MFKTRDDQPKELSPTSPLGLLAQFLAGQAWAKHILRPADRGDTCCEECGQPLLRAAEVYAYALILGGDTESAGQAYEKALDHFVADFADRMHGLSTVIQPKETTDERL